MVSLGGLATLESDAERARDLLLEALSLANQTPDPSRIADAFRNLGTFYLAQGELLGCPKSRAIQRPMRPSPTRPTTRPR
jgi:hypothetical protein